MYVHKGAVETAFSKQTKKHRNQATKAAILERVICLRGFSFSGTRLRYSGLSGALQVALVGT